MAWELAIVGSLMLVVLGLFILVGIFDKMEHALFSLFLFFIGLFFIIITLNVDSNVLVANNATINNAEVFSDLGDNIGTAYWLSIWVLFVSLMYWFIYILRKALETLKLKKIDFIEGNDDE